MLTESIAVSTDVHVFASAESSRTFRAFLYFFICHVRMILLIVFICLASGIMFSFSLVAGIANLLIPADMVRAVQKVIRQNAMQSGTSTFVGILLYITGAPGAFFQSLEPGDQQRKIGSLNCSWRVLFGRAYFGICYCIDVI